ncbi:MAG: hypothetical protein AB7F75_04890 [Planctomycetota bacterium]
MNGHPCPLCRSTLEPVFVHGHYQCATCKQNIIPCCNGDMADDPSCSSITKTQND